VLVWTVKTWTEAMAGKNPRYTCACYRDKWDIDTRRSSFFCRRWHFVNVPYSF